MAGDIERLLAFGRMGLETGYYEQARDNFEQVLALDPSNREAMRGLARAKEILSRREDVQSARRTEPARQEPVKPPPTVEPQRTVPEWRAQEWQGSPGMESQKQPGLRKWNGLSKRGDSMEPKTYENLEWLSLQLKHVPVKTWIIVFVKMGVAYMFLMSILAVIAVVSSLALAKIGVSILEMLSGL